LIDVSYVGYQNKQFAVNGETEFQISLEESSVNMNEVCGIWDCQEKDITGQ
jgi:hypothetical protein